MRRSSRQPNPITFTTDFGNPQDRDATACPMCGVGLRATHPLRQLLGAELSPAALEARFLTHPEFAEQFLAVNRLALTSAARDLTKEALAAAPDPVLRAWILASNDIGRNHTGQRRLRQRIVLGKLRHLCGDYAGMPVAIPPLPPRQHEHDELRIFANRDTLEWIVVSGERVANGWRPKRRWIGKELIAAMLGLKECTVSSLIRERKLPGRIPKHSAPIKGEACFVTETVMRWGRMRLCMGAYHPPY